MPGGPGTDAHLADRQGGNTDAHTPDGQVDGTR